VGEPHTADSNLYWKENQDLRELTGASGSRRALIMRTWRPHLAHFMKAIKMLPAYTGSVYRGRMESHEELLKEYFQGRRVCWAGISSCSTEITVAYKRATMGYGVVMQIMVQNGRQMGDISMYPDESEIILAPGMNFAVVGPIKKRPVYVDGEVEFVSVLPMIEIVGEQLVS
jgi:hypothetical protein